MPKRIDPALPEVTERFALFRNTLYKLSHTTPPASSPNEHVDAVLAATIEALEEFLGCQLIIATARERSGYSRQRLRPICGRPSSISDYFESNENRYDNITVATFDDDQAGYKVAFDELDQSSDPTRSKMYTFFCNTYPISGDQNTRMEQIRNTCDLPSFFRSRINNFLHDVERGVHSGQKGSKSTSYISARELTTVYEDGLCIVFGRIAPWLADASGELGSPRIEGTTPIDQLFAVYVTPASSIAAASQITTNLCRYVAEMFRAFDEITFRARERFETSALREITRLIPMFSNPEISPSSAISELVATYNNIFTNHPTIGPGRFRREGMENTQWVRFLNIEYASIERTRSPTFYVYPKAHAELSYVNSYLMSRRDKRAISKYLHWSYCMRANVRLPNAYSDLFQEVKVSQGSFYPRRAGRPVALVLTEGDEGWRELSLDIAQEGYKTRTTAAFLLTRGGDKAGAPFGVLIFESDSHDAFSDADIRLLDRLVEASAFLLAHLKLGAARVNYSTLLKAAMRQITTSHVGDSRAYYSDVIYELVRIDAIGACQILQTKDPSLWKGSALADEKVRGSLLAILAQLPPPEDQMGIMRKVTEAEFKNQIDATWSEHIAEIDRFLTAVPSNNVWHCYLGSIARALADRDFSPSKLPGFSLFKPGFSALAMFVVEGKRTIRQVIKLADRERLTRERDNYVESVRYRIPLAARLSANGYAFDTLGWVGKRASRAASKAKDVGYGVLVSDLVGGIGEGAGSVPVSLLSKSGRFVHEVDINEEGSKARRDLDAVTQAITHHFRSNVSLWRNEGEADFEVFLEKFKDEAGLETFIEQIARTTKPDAPAYGVNARRIETRLSAMADQFPSHVAKGVGEFLWAAFRYYRLYVHPIADAPSNIERSIAGLLRYLTGLRHNPLATEGMAAAIHPNPPFRCAINHGDLNGNNLTWGENYQRFFLIDFEYVCMGFEGADQLKLVCSLICESAAQRRQEEADANVRATRRLAMRERDHESFIIMIRAVRMVRDMIKEYPDVRDAFRALRDRISKIDPQLDILLAIVGTIYFPNTIADRAKRMFWDMVLREIMFRQFEYAFRDLGPRDEESLSVGVANLAKYLGDDQQNLKLERPSDAIDDPRGDLIVRVPFPLSGVEDTMRDVRDLAVTKIYYAFLAVLATT